MEFKSVDGSFVFSSRAGKVCKVPATPEDAMASSLMGMMEKTRMVQLVMWVNKVRHGQGVDAASPPGRASQRRARCILGAAPKAPRWVTGATSLGLWTRSYLWRVRRVRRAGAPACKLSK